MTHRATGLRSILDHAGVYERFQRLLGARAARQRLVREFLRPFDGARILDVGCGTGSLLDYLPANVEYVGFDPNPAYIEAARRRYGDRGRFFCDRVGSNVIALENGAFDFVVAKSLLHHLSDAEVHDLLGAASRLLKKGGVFFSSDPARHAGQGVLTRILLSLDRGGSIRSPEGYAQLIGAHFSRMETTVVRDLLPIPYSHFIARTCAV